MIQVRSANTSIFVNAAFAPPLFEWQGVAARFFEMVHSALTPSFTVNPRDFSARTGSSLDEVWARYNIFGGSSAVVLSAEKLSIEFPNVLPTEYEIVLRIIGQMDTSFSVKFPDRQYTSIQATVFEHAQIIAGGSPAEYLYKYAIPSVNKLCEDIGAVQVPSGQFSIMGNDGTWRASCLVEKSEHVQNGLFLHFDIALLSLGQNEPFDSKFGRINNISNACMTSLGLERENAS